MKNVYLYGALDSTISDLYQIKEYMDSIKVEYTHLFYSDSSQFNEVLKAVKTWFPGKTVKFPFVVWDDDQDVRKLASTLKEVKATFNAKPTPEDKKQS